MADLDSTGGTSGNRNAFDDDLLPCGVLVATLDGELRHVNRWMRESLGYDAASFTARHLDELLSKPGQILYRSYVLPFMRTNGRVEELSLSFRTRSGAAVEAIVSGTLRETDPECTEVILAVTPMIKRRFIEEELLRMRRAAESSPGMLFELRRHADGHFDVPYASPGIRELFGLRPEQVRTSAEPLFERLQADDRRALLEALRAAPGEPAVRRVEFRVLRTDRRQALYEAQVMRTRESGVTLWHGFVSDVTDRREIERAAMESEAAQRANRAKSDFLARMSHELRTPLNAIIGFAQLLAEGVAGAVNPEQHRQLQIIDASGQHLLRLIEDVLDISRIESGRLPIDAVQQPLAPVLERSVRMVEASARGTGICIDAPLPADTVTVVADPRRLEQVLVNLLSNAVKYNRPQGEVKVRVSSGEAVRIEVEDTGIGMDDEQLRGLFQPFNRLGAERRSIEGTGLGLVIARSLVEGMRGSLEVRSTPNVGTTFTVTLPSGDAAEAVHSLRPAAALPSTPTMTTARPRRRVLYVEDNAVNAMLMRAIFGRRPEWTLAIAQDGETALTEVGQVAPDLMLVDLSLPDMDGIEFLRRVRRLPNGRGVPAVMVSAAAFEADQQRAQEAGFVEYWTKPIGVEHALHRLDALLDPQHARAS